MDLFFEPAADEHRRDTFHALEEPFDLLLAYESQTDEVLVTEETEPHNRVERGVVAQKHGPVGIVGKNDEVEPLAHVERRHVHVGVPAKLERDFTRVGARARDDAHDVVDDAHRVLDGFGDEALHLGGRGTFELRSDGDRRVSYLGEEVDRELTKPDDTEDDRGDEEHEDGDGAAR